MPLNEAGFRVQYDFPTDVAPGGRMSVARYEMRYVRSHVVPPGYRGSVDAGIEWADYSRDRVPVFAAASGAEGNLDLDDLQTVLLGYTAQVRTRSPWMFWGRAGVRSEGSPDAEFEDTVTGYVMGSGAYAVNPRLSLMVGFGVLTHLEDDALVMPMLGWRWTIREGLVLWTDGPGVRLDWRLTPSVETRLRARWESRDYRLGRRTGLAGGVLEDERVVLQWETLWRPKPFLELEAGLGMSAFQDHDWYDASGVKVLSMDADPAVHASAGAKVRF